MSKRALTVEQNERVRAILRQLLEDRFEGKVTRLASELGVSHPSVVEVIAGTRHAGFRLVSALADYTERGIDDILSDASRVARPRSATELGAREDWPDLRAQTEDRYRGRIDRDVLDDVARMSFGRPPEIVTVEDIKRWHDMLVDIYSREPRAKEAARK